MQVLLKKDKYSLVKYDCGLFAVGIYNKNVGMDIFTSFDKNEVENYFTQI